MSAPAVVTRDLARSYQTTSGAVRALNGVDLDIATGSRVAIMGPSGCGKSTLLSIIGGLESPTGGQVTVLGTELTALNDAARTAWRRANLGFIFQAYDLLPFLTVTENVALQAGIAGGDALEPVDDLLVRLGLGDHLDKLPDQLSGGQKQRVGIGRCLIHRPRLILADEPTGGLDSTTSRSVIDALLEAAESIDATVVVVTHDEVVGARFGEVVHLRDGCVAPPTSKAGQSA